jgi:hypothetical protein
LLIWDGFISRFGCYRGQSERNRKYFSDHSIDSPYVIVVTCEDGRRKKKKDGRRTCGLMVMGLV